MTRMNFLAHPELRKQYEVILSETGEALENVAWADDVTGEYATVLTRPRDLSDGPDADLKVRRSDGSFVLTTKTAPIEFSDLTADPFKQELLRLLRQRDPEVIRALKAVTR